MRLDAKQQMVAYINRLQDYQPYVQFSHRPIEKSKDIFVEYKLQIKSDVSNTDMQAFITDIEKPPKLKMAQIWEESDDELCENMPVKKLKKVLFTGFDHG